MLRYLQANEVATTANAYTRHLRAVIVPSPCTRKRLYSPGNPQLMSRSSVDSARMTRCQDATHAPVVLYLFLRHLYTRRLPTRVCREKLYCGYTSRKFVFHYARAIRFRNSRSTITARQRVCQSVMPVNASQTEGVSLSGGHLKASSHWLHSADSTVGQHY